MERLRMGGKMRDIEYRIWNKIISQIQSVIEINFQHKYVIVSIPQKEYTHKYYFPDIELIQYTCMKDKNGVKIYEGDIIQSQTLTGEVRFKDGCFVVFCEIYYRFDSAINGWEIIGNIHENPYGVIKS